MAALLAVGALAAAPGAARAAVPAYAPHEVIVGYRRPVTHRHGPGSIGPDAAALAAADRAPVHMRVVRLDGGESVGAALRRLRGRPGVAFAEPDYLARAAGVPAATGAPVAHTASAPFFPDDRGRLGRAQGWERLQWNLLDATGGIDAPQAWANLLADRRTGARGVRIAVLDTGIAYRDWGAFRQSPDLRGTHFVDPYDFVDHNRYPLDRDGHGTFVASVIGEATNNGLGLTGLAYGATIMPVRVLSANELGEESTIAAGIRYAVAKGAQIINLSLEFVPQQVHSAAQIPAVASAVQDARRHGVMVVAAAGNDQERQLAFPARLPGVVAVGATTRDACLAGYSDTGSGLALVAPGGGSDAIMPSDPACHPQRDLPPVYQMTLDDPPHWNAFGYPSFYIGTSMAAPEVSAAAAMVIASGVIGRHPTPDQVLRRLERTATPLPAGGRQPNPTYGWGLLNVGAATSAVTLPSMFPG